MLRTLAADLILHEGVTTTAAKARAIRPLVERAISRSKNNTVVVRRYLMKTFTTESPVHKLMEVLGPRFSSRQGGYTRMIRLGARKGDAAEMVRIELV